MEAQIWKQASLVSNAQTALIFSRSFSASESLDRKGRGRIGEVQRETEGPVDSEISACTQA